MYQSDGCGVTVLVCFGYHPITTYKWYRDDITNPFPVLYIEESGNYKCIMESEKGRKVHEFTVVGKSQLRHAPLIYASYVLGSVIMCYIQMESTF